MHLKAAITCMLLFLSCARHHSFEVEVKDNPCVFREKLAEKPFAEGWNDAEDKVEWVLIDSSRSMSRTLRLTNGSERALRFFEPEDAPLYSAFGRRDQGGSLWPGQDETQAAYLQCIGEQQYSVSILEYEGEYTLVLSLFRDNRLGRGESMDFRIGLDKPGIYRVVLFYKPVVEEGVSGWGIGRTRSVVSAPFRVW